MHCGIFETVEHVLLYCRAYNNERKTLEAKVLEEVGNMTLEDILNTIQKNTNIRFALIKYLKDTGNYIKNIMMSIYLFIFLFIVITTIIIII